MSEFKFACPVCGQHITADSAAAGTRLDCPTCFRKIVVPQAPASTDPKFILSAAEADKPRAPQAGAKPRLNPLEPVRERMPIPPWVMLAVGAVCLAGATLFVFGGKLFHSARTGNGSTNAPAPEVLHLVQTQKHGGIGLGAWNTTVEFSNVVVSKGTQTLYQSDFSSGASGWQFFSGHWITTNGVIRQTAVAEDCRATTGSNDWSNYTVRLRARKLAGEEGFLILFNVADDQNWTWWNLGGWRNTRHALENCVSGTKSRLGTSVSGQIERGRWYDVRIELNSPSIRCYLDDALIEDAAYQPSQPPSSSSSQPRASSSGLSVPPPVPGAPEGPWTLNLAGTGIPETIAKGKVRGDDFVCERSVLQGGVLHLRQGKTWPPDRGFSVYLPAKQDEELSSKSISVAASDASAPRVALRWKENQEPKSKSFNGSYAMKLEFGGIVTNRISGRIYLCLPDEAKSFVAGAFDAELRKPSP